MDSNIFFPTLIRKANIVFLVLVILGGIMYSIGAYFFVRDYKKYYHMIWHLFINIAAILHLIGIGFSYIAIKIVKSRGNIHLWFLLKKNMYLHL